MLKANHAKVEWDERKKRWEVHIQVGAEVIKRPLPDQKLDSGEEAIRSAAIATARDEGYELDAAQVEIAQSVRR